MVWGFAPHARFRSPPSCATSGSNSGLPRIMLPAVFMAVEIDFMDSMRFLTIPLAPECANNMPAATASTAMSSSTRLQAACLRSTSDAPRRHSLRQRRTIRRHDGTARRSCGRGKGRSGCQQRSRRCRCRDWRQFPKLQDILGRIRCSDEHFRSLEVPLAGGSSPCSGG